MLVTPLCVGLEILICGNFLGLSSNTLLLSMPLPDSSRGSCSVVTAVDYKSEDPYSF